MNKTANIQASFSLPDVLVEDKIERMGNNQMKITIPKNRSMAKDSAPIVYAVQGLHMALWRFRSTFLSPETKTGYRAKPLLAAVHPP